MSEPASFAVIRNGSRHDYSHRWAAGCVHNVLFRGPKSFFDWVDAECQPAEDFWDVGHGAIANLDKGLLTWAGYHELFEQPRHTAYYDRLLEAAWPGYQVHYAHDGTSDLVRAAGRTCEGHEDPYALVPLANEALAHSGQDIFQFPPALTQLTNRPAPDEYDDSPTVWLTVVSTCGATRQIVLETSRLPDRVLQSCTRTFRTLLAQAVPEVPAERGIFEGLIVDAAQNQVELWGDREAIARLSTIRSHWKSWRVVWNHRGYSRQCEQASTNGTPLMEKEILRAIVQPHLGENEDREYVERLIVAAGFEPIDLE
ncbi:MAG: hypothetical protein KDB22_25125 [Planctomycetales bacterium]|nr:hypothetical protein [Planctomycetales bacterium]